MSTTRIPLDTPIARGETQITELQLRKPASGELRGLSLSALREWVYRQDPTKIAF